MANPKRKLLRVLSAVYAVLLLLTLGFRVGSRAVERQEKRNRFVCDEKWVSEYQKGIPLEEMDFHEIGRRYLSSPVSAVSTPSPNIVVAPCDIEYYKQEDGQKVMVQTIPKGTYLYWHFKPEYRCV